MDHQQIAHLLELYFIGHITPAQKDQLAAWIEEHGHTPEFEQLMASSWQQFQPAQQVDAAKAGAWLQHIHLRSAELERTVKDGRLTLTEQPAADLNSTMAAGQGSTDRPGNTPVIGMRARRRNWYMAAAAVVLIAGTVIVARMVYHKNDTPAPQAIAGKQDIAPPAVSKAVLTLANGQQIVLDSAAQGALASQGSVRVVKLEDGRIAYEGQANGALQYNTLTVPAGSNITSITLADGTTVLLNAASSITYPVAFTGNERKVTITGEVWFEVAKDPTKKFLVSAANATLEVLGTKFNVNAYSDEGQVKVTLAEGSLRVKTGIEGSNMQNGPVLKPGQQAIVTAGHLVLNNEPDMEQVLAWKNGMFLYKGTDIRTIMRELARVYKVEVSYESVSKEMFYAETPRNTNISSLFNMLELTGKYTLKIEGNKVTVLK